MQIEHTPELHCDTPVTEAVSTVDATVSQKPSVEEILRAHTAVRPSRRLSVAYAMQSFITGIPLLMIDLAVTSSCLVTTALLVDIYYVGQPFHPGTWNQLPAILVLQWLFLSLHQLYPGVGVGNVFELRGLTRATVCSFILLALLNAWFGELPRYEFASFVISGTLVCVLLPFARWMGRRALAKTTWWGLRVLVLGDRFSALQTCQELSQNLNWGFRPIGYGCDSDDQKKRWGPDELYAGPITDGVETAIRHRAPVIVIASGEADLSWVIERLAFQCPAVVSFQSMKSPLLCNNPFQSPCTFATHFNSPLLKLVPRLFKRFCDLAICVPAILLLCPIAFLIGYLIRRGDPGPVFFGHERVGQHGKKFRAWKFRSMVVDAENVLQEYLQKHPELKAEWEADHKLRDDPRVIRGIGTLLRKWSIDEFPQLWNIVKGEMSLVGPRPIIEAEIAKYSEGYFAYSHMVPGLTGLWQVSGRNDTTYAERVKLDGFYARNWSPWLDIWILVRTPYAVLKSDGAY
ncbi:UDP-glucose:undecaprenyl-phosphate glucose-1-phosphate transferase [Novipirellula galeiformis]|uniref:UDP-glucose:undecaprenyl-phosphate glucose-1-phosphate transferase n=1 Tax=Novipirellula galeiformis TaxID=2528004 RepID=A0A5C6CGR1_9BACT|nr:exopolysaccharide biosynthesis polyprenyl glycosylphosphotransferase [Novipirellula galeiformis]TWU22917.1 UDP-glucose:undecaprenyl-phosphate glucose-1-phosphate transferase [Novipirellula galeiformis]